MANVIMASVIYGKCYSWQTYYCKFNYGKFIYGKSIMSNVIEPKLALFCTLCHTIILELNSNVDWSVFLKGL